MAVRLSALRAGRSLPPPPPATALFSAGPFNCAVPTTEIRVYFSIVPYLHRKYARFCTCTSTYRSQQREQVYKLKTITLLISVIKLDKVCLCLLLNVDTKSLSVSCLRWIFHGIHYNWHVHKQIINIQYRQTEKNILTLSTLLQASIIITGLGADIQMLSLLTPYWRLSLTALSMVGITSTTRAASFYILIRDRIQHI
jgi:hypothetical protein